MNFHHALGINKSAGLKEIKRAYAVKLKLHRPDEDPIGFQKINTAYQMALQYAAARIQREEERQFETAGAMHGNDLGTFDDEPIRNENSVANNGDDQIDTGTKDDDTHALQAGGKIRNNQEHTSPRTEHPEVFDLADFYEQFRIQAQSGNTDALKKWLDNYPALYSISLKHQVTEPLLLGLESVQEPVRSDALEILLRFFSLDSVMETRHWVYHKVENARQRSDDYWRNERLAKAYQFKSDKVKPIEHMLFKELEGPKNQFRRLFILAFPGLIWRTRDIALKFETNGQPDSKQYLDPGSTKFWLSVSNTRKISLWRILGALIPSMALAAFFQYVGAAKGDYAFGAIFGSIYFSIWLFVSTAKMLQTHIRDYLEKNPHINRSHAYSIPLLLFALATSPIEASMVFGMIPNLAAAAFTFQNGKKGVRLLALLTAVLICLFILHAADVRDASEYIKTRLITIAPALAIGTIIVHDMLIAKFKKLSVSDVHLEWKWLNLISVVMACGLFSN